MLAPSVQAGYYAVGAALVLGAIYLRSGGMLELSPTSPSVYLLGAMGLTICWLASVIALTSVSTVVWCITVGKSLFRDAAIVLALVGTFIVLHDGDNPLEVMAEILDYIDWGLEYAMYAKNIVYAFLGRRG